MTDLGNCTVCGRPRWRDGDLSGCSEFCDVATPEEKAAFLNLKVGDHGVWPCSVCGCVVEDEYSGPEAHCYQCHPKWMLKKAEALLIEVVEDVEAWDGPQHFGDGTVGLRVDQSVWGKISKYVKERKA